MSLGCVALACCIVAFPSSPHHGLVDLAHRGHAWIPTGRVQPHNNGRGNRSKQHFASHMLPLPSKMESYPEPIEDLLPTSSEPPVCLAGRDSSDKRSQYALRVW